MTIRSRSPWMIAALVGAMAGAGLGPVLAQSSQPPAAASPAPSTGSPAQPLAERPPEPPPKSAYSYDPDGRRDPFVSLLNRGVEARPTGKRPDGIPGLLIAELVVKGIVKSREGLLAMVQGSDKKVYLLRASDRLYDGTVGAVTADGIIFRQEVNDPLSLKKEREVRKLLRPIEEGK